MLSTAVLLKPSCTPRRTNRKAPIGSASTSMGGGVAAPFAAVPSKNHHDVERFAELISTEVLDMLRRARLRDGGALPTAGTPAAAQPSLLRARTLYGITTG